MSVRINLEIGHEASLRTKRTQEGFTHDWEVFVRGCDGADISHYVDKVVFYLHETFPRPRRVVKEPPYSLKESGYAGFNLPIDIYLKNKDEPKRIKFNYDLSLQQNGPAIHKSQKEKFTFKDPTDEFKHRLLNGGGTFVSSSSSNDSDTKISSDAKQQLINKPKLGGSNDPKKHKAKIEEPKDSTWSFNSLFGMPIKRTKTPEVFNKEPNKKEKEKEKIVEKERKIKSAPKERDKEKREKDERKKEKSKERSKDHERKEKKRDKSPKRSPSPVPRRLSPKREVWVSPKRPASPVDVKMPKDDKRKEKEKDKEKDDKKYKKRDKEKDYENKHKDKEYKNKEIKVSTVSREREPSPRPAAPPVTIKPDKKDKTKEIAPKPKTAEILDVPAEKPKFDEKKDKHKHKKKDKDRDKEKEKRDKGSHKLKSEKKYDPSLFSSPKPEKKKFTAVEENDNSNSSTSSTKDVEMAYKPPSPAPPAAAALPQSSVDNKVDATQQKTKRDKSKKKEKREDKKRKRRDISPENEEEPDVKIIKEEIDVIDVDAPQENPEDYMRILQDLQHKIMSLNDNTELQKVVKLIAETGRYEVSARTFDFDLCLLERSTVRRLQEFFSVSS